MNDEHLCEAAMGLMREAEMMVEHAGVALVMDKDGNRIAVGTLADVYEWLVVRNEGSNRADA